jgi:hypothetical protein
MSDERIRNNLEFSIISDSVRCSQQAGEFRRSQPKISVKTPFLVTNSTEKTKERIIPVCDPRRVSNDIIHCVERTGNLRNREACDPRGQQINENLESLIIYLRLTTRDWV